jgi:hypothetical protein
MTQGSVVSVDLQSCKRTLTALNMCVVAWPGLGLIELVLLSVACLRLTG